MNCLTRSQVHALGLRRVIVEKLLSSLTPVMKTPTTVLYSITDINNYLEKILGYTINIKDVQDEDEPIEFSLFEDRKGSLTSDIQHLLTHYGRLSFLQILYTLRYLKLRRSIKRHTYDKNWSSFVGDYMGKEFNLNVKKALNILLERGNIRLGCIKGVTTYYPLEPNFTSYEFTYGFLESLPIENITVRFNDIVLLALGKLYTIDKRRKYDLRKRLVKITKQDLSVFYGQTNLVIRNLLKDVIQIETE